MKVLSFDQVSASDWDEVVNRSSAAWLFHRAGWVGIEAAFFARGNRSFAVIDGRDNDCVGICPLYERTLGRGAWIERILDSGHHRHSGPALRDDLPQKVLNSARALCMQHIMEEAERLDVDRVLLNAHNLAPANLDGRSREMPFWALEHGFQWGLHFGPNGDLALPGLSTLCLDQIVHLDPPEDILFERLGQKCRNAVRKAVKSGVTVETATADPIDEYYALAELSAQRTAETLLPKQYYRRIWDSFSGEGRCAVRFGAYQRRRIAAVLLIIDKDSASFSAGVSDPEYLPLRVNNLLHWDTIRWAKGCGLHRYRLGPTFPELPNDWPVSTVSWFKGTFGGVPVPIIQGSYFRKPERYRDDAIAAVNLLCKERIGEGTSGGLSQFSFDENGTVPFGRASPTANYRRDLATILRTYGSCGALDQDAEQRDLIVMARGSAAGLPLALTTRGGETNGGAIADCREELAGQLLYRPGRLRIFVHRTVAYRTLLPSVSFQGPHLEPLWTTAEGRAVVAWSHSGGQRSLLVGLDVVEEMLRYRQGDPAKVERNNGKAKFGFDFERPNYLFEDHISAGNATVPWADRLGFLVAECLARLMGVPLMEPLPGGAKGLVILTGDDDQAHLEKYAEQLQMVGGLPITYFLVPQTRHVRETLERLPAGVEIGLHPDALDAPDQYDPLCTAQARQIRELSGKPVRTVRNHGYLNRGYLGHLQAWEENGLELDVNLPGVDGTALNGSFLPMRVRRTDGAWSNHYTLLTAFGDGMVEAMGMSGRHAARQIRRLSRQIERDRPGVLVCNFHPQNTAHTRALHEEAVALARRRGWRAMGLETYLDWLRTLETIRIEKTDAGIELTSSSPQTVQGLVLRAPVAARWRRVELPPWSGRTTVRLP